MSLTINTNVSALTALYNLNQTEPALQTAIQRLSSGLRINSAADDPAGLIVSDHLQSQIGGLNQAINNAQNGANLIKTAEAALSQVSSLLDSINQLAVNAANTGVNDSNMVQADQTQIQSAIQSIDSIATQTQFADKNLLDGTSGVTSNVVNTADIAGISIGGTYDGYQTTSGNVTMSVSTAATRAAVTGSSAVVSYGALSSTIGSSGTIVINGQSISVSSTDTVQTLLDKINGVTSQTGVTANYDTTNKVIDLSQQNYGSNFKIVESESATFLFGTLGTSVVGANAVVSVSAKAMVNGTATTETVTFTGGTNSTDSGLLVKDSYGNSILLTEQGNTSTGSVAVGSVTAGTVQFQVGANSGQTVSISLGNVQTNQLGTTAVSGLDLRTINVTTAQGASDAMQVVQQALSQVDTLRAQMGAFETDILNSNVQSLGIAVQNLSASESQIRDANIPQEVMNMTKYSILQQSGISVLAQANSLPQALLKLLP